MRKLKKHSCCEKCAGLTGNGGVFGGNCSEMEKLATGWERVTFAVKSSKNWEGTKI